MAHTHFKNATGPARPGHYTTCHGHGGPAEAGLKTRISRELLHFDYQTEPVGTPGAWAPPALSSLMDTPSPDGVTLLGGKTGYTEEAGLCLASPGKKRQKKVYYPSPAGAPGSHETSPRHLEDAFRLFGLVDCV